MIKVVDSAVQKAYKGEKKIAWYEVFVGEKCYQKFKDHKELSQKSNGCYRTLLKRLTIIRFY